MFLDADPDCGKVHNRVAPVAYGGGMDDPVTARTAAEAAAEALRTLNHLTLAPPAVWTPGWEDFADVYAIAAELQVLAQRLPQAIGQLAQVFDDAHVVYASDNDDHPADVIAAARHGLIDAGGHAEALRATLERAQGAISHLYVDGHVAVDDTAGE